MGNEVLSNPDGTLEWRPGAPNSVGRRKAEGLLLESGAMPKPILKTYRIGDLALSREALARRCAHMTRDPDREDRNLPRIAEDYHRLQLADIPT